MEAIRNQYEKLGVAKFYQNFGNDYKNPHEPIIKIIVKEICTSKKFDMSNILDLAAGTGEVTRVLIQNGYTSVIGADPYTSEAYYQRTGIKPLIASFEDIQAGILSSESYSLIICSFALHLLDPGRLPGLIFQLASITKHLVIITPNKRPDIKDEWGFELIEETLVQRVRMRVYKSTMI